VSFPLTFTGRPIHCSPLFAWRGRQGLSRPHNPPLPRGIQGGSGIVPRQRGRSKKNCLKKDKVTRGPSSPTPVAMGPSRKSCDEGSKQPGDLTDGGGYEATEADQFPVGEGIVAGISPQMMAGRVSEEK
jgi:hypothetical protein